MSVRETLGAEGALAAALAPRPAPPLLAPLVTPPLEPRQADGLDMILEGFLLHHGRPRHLVPADRAAAVLAGDYCYAAGLIRIAAAGDLFHVRALADLIAMGSALVAAGRRDGLAPLWRATAAAMAARSGGGGAPAAGDYRAGCELMRGGEVAAGVRRLERLAAAVPSTPELSEVLA